MIQDSFDWKKKAEILIGRSKKYSYAEFSSQTTDLLNGESVFDCNSYSCRMKIFNIFF